jgi:hypothetical protein
MPDTKERMKSRRAEAGDEGRAKDAVRKRSQRVEAGDEGRAKDAVRKRSQRVEAGEEGRTKEVASRKKRRRAEAGNKPVDERLRLYRLIKSRAMRLADLDIAADDASLDKLNLDELNDFMKSLDKHLQRASSHNLLIMIVKRRPKEARGLALSQGPSCARNFQRLQRRTDGES